MASAFDAIRAIDYMVIFTRDLPGMRRFYQDVLRFAFLRELTPRWIEFAVGAQTLALCEAPEDRQTSGLQLAFRVPLDTVAACAAELEAKGIPIERPVTDQPFGHRTLFFRDPDGNIIEIYAEI